MNGFKFRRLLAAAVLAPSLVAVAVVAAPAVAVDACMTRTASVADAMRMEGDQDSSTLRFEVSTTGCAEASVQVRAVTVRSTPTMSPASELIDYIYPGVALDWSSNDTNASRTVSVTIVGDTRVEHNEMFLVELFSPSTGLTLTDATAYGTIINDDIPDLIPDNEPDCGGMEGTLNCSLDILVSRRPEVDLTVQYSTVDGTAVSNEDFFGVTRGTLFIPAGETRGTISVAYRTDRRMTAPEYFYVTIFEPSLGTITVSRQKLILPMP